MQTAQQTAQVVFRIDAQARREFKAMTAMEGKTQTEVLRAAVMDFLARTPTERRAEAA